jgi:hypothetical protein
MGTPLPMVSTLQLFRLAACVFLLTSTTALAETPWLALTMAPSGDWGAGVSKDSYVAIANAIRDCRQKSKRPAVLTGCGGVVRMRRNGWGIAVACQQTWFVTVGESLQAAELELREWQWRHMADGPFVFAECRRVVVQPNGSALEDGGVLGFATAAAHAN